MQVFKFMRQHQRGDEAAAVQLAPVMMTWNAKARLRGASAREQGADRGLATWCSTDADVDPAALAGAHAERQARLRAQFPDDCDTVVPFADA